MKVSGVTLKLNGATVVEAVTLDANGVLQGTGTSGLSGVLTLANATHTLTATTAGTDVLTVSGQVTGVGGFSKTGAGEVILSNNTNDYTGVSSVTAGTLTASAANALG